MQRRLRGGLRRKCGEYVLTGKFENAATSYAMIKCGKTVEDMDTIRLSADGSFRYVRKLEKPAISFMMVPETGFFSVIMINGTRNHIEADLSRVGDCRITGDLADAHRLYAELQREMKEKTGQVMPLSRRPNLPLRISASVRKNVWLTSLIPLSAAWRSANWMLLLS